MTGKDRILNASRAERRLMRRSAIRTAQIVAGGGFFEFVDTGRGVAKVEAPASIAALTSAIQRFIEGGCRPHIERLGEAAAMGLPSAALRPAWAQRCFLQLDLDRDGRIAWVSMWVAGNAPPTLEAEMVAARGRPSLEKVCATPGFGDLKTRGRA